MDLGREFNKFAGYGSLRGENYMKHQVTNLTPYILEERALNVTQMDVYSRLMKERIIFFNEDVRDDNMGMICAQYLFLDSIDDSPITIYLNSPGGGVIAGLSLYDTILSAKSRYEPTTMGMAASMGSILATIKKLHKDDPKDTKTRSILPHSRIMIHDIRGGGSNGVYKDQLINLNLSGELRNELFTILSKNSNFSFAEIEELCDRDHWINAEKALEYGFVDEIVNRNG